MNRFLKILLCVFLLIVCHSCRRFRLMTHLSDEELEWLTNRYVGETMYFQSRDGILDTVKIAEIVIRNTTDSIDWNYYTTGGDGVYYARGNVWFGLRDIPYFNRFSLRKDSDEYIYFSAEILRVWMPEVHLIDSCMQIDSIVFEDVVFFDESVMRPVSEYNPKVPITSLAWSKKYGLVQYTFQDGTEFNRIDLNK